MEGRGLGRAAAGWTLCAALAGVLLGTGAAQAQSAGTVIAGPFTVTLPSTRLFAFSTSFNVPPPIAHSYVVRVSLSAPNSLTAASVNLNNAQLLSLSDFAGGVTSVDRVVTLLLSNTIALQVAGATGTKITITVFTVVMPKPVSLAPDPLALTAGTGGTLTATLSPVPTAAGTLDVTSANPAVAAVSSPVAFASGQASVAIPVSALGSGSTLVTASANGGQASATVNVNAPPSVSITAPAAGAVFLAPANITVSAEAADTDGTVAKVEFFDGATPVGTATAAPYSVTLANVAAGTHALTAVATDNQGASTPSAAVAVTVNAAPSVSITSPANGAVFNAPATIAITASATDPDGTIAKVEFYQGTTLITTLTAAPYTIQWTGVPAGSYSLTAVATDNQGASTTSAAVNIKVNAAPSVSLTSPANGATFTAPATIPLAAEASDTDGTVAKVELFQGTTLIATVTTAPYNFSWTEVAQGSYTLTAVATDNDGAATTSAPVTITVNSAVKQIYYIHPDHLNTPRMIANQAGTTVWRWDNTEPFGAALPNDDPDGDGAPFVFDLRFPGQYFDRETNVSYNYRRDYDSSIGRYVESDPIGLKGGVNTYLYVLGRPLTNRDPRGLDVDDCSMGVCGPGVPPPQSCFDDPASCPPPPPSRSLACDMDNLGDCLLQESLIAVPECAVCVASRGRVCDLCKLAAPKIAACFATFCKLDSCPAR